MITFSDGVQFALGQAVVWFGVLLIVLGAVGLFYLVAWLVRRT
jgi:hypothetical protein